jgi:hypothetical protein
VTPLVSNRRVRNDRLWPFDIRVAVLWAPLLLVGLILGLAVLRQLSGWPPTALDQPVFLAIVVVSLLPVVLAVVDLVADRGGSISVQGVKLDFAVASAVVPSYEVPRNIGLPGTPVTDSGTENIVEALRGASASDVVVVDLQAGEAWWETRLLVFLAGATRVGRPDAVVFVAHDGEVPGCFQGWGRPSALLPPLLRSDRRYREAFYRAHAWARRWELAEPVVTPPQASARARRQAANPKLPASIGAPHSFIAIEDGLPNEFAFERLLQSELGTHIEANEEPRTVGIARLQELFRAVLHPGAIDEGWPSEKQIDAILGSEAPYLAVVQSGRYLRLIPRLTGIAAILRSVTSSQRRRAG